MLTDRLSLSDNRSSALAAVDPLIQELGTTQVGCGSPRCSNSSVSHLSATCDDCNLDDVARDHDAASLNPQARHINLVVDPPRVDRERRPACPYSADCLPDESAGKHALLEVKHAARLLRGFRIMRDHDDR